MTTTLVDIDTETTGLDPVAHQAYEVCIWPHNMDQPITYHLPHTLEFADPFALEIGQYHQRGFSPDADPGQRYYNVQRLHSRLEGVTLVGANPRFDAEMLSHTFRRAGLPPQPWHHRLINVSEGAMWLFGWDRPRGLADVIKALNEIEYEIPAPDHTAEGDVRCTREVYRALVDLQHR